MKVWDDNRPAAQIVDFRSEQNLPLRLALLIDTSGSVKNRFAYETQAAARFVNGVADPRGDQVFVAGFSHQMQVVQDFTSDLHKVGSALQQLHDDQRETALFDAVADACEKLAASGQQPKVARVLVVISDGDDNASKYALKDAARIAEWDEVTISTIIGQRSLGHQPGGRLRAAAADAGEWRHRAIFLVPEANRPSIYAHSERFAEPLRNFLPPGKFPGGWTLSPYPSRGQANGEQTARARPQRILCTLILQPRRLLLAN